jgi:hypothetical protein
VIRKGEYLQSLNKPFRVMFIFIRFRQKASFLQALIKINNPADAGFVKTLRREGITCGDPFGGSLATPNYSLTRFTRMVFLFSVTFSNCVWKAPKTKIPQLR